MTTTHQITCIIPDGSDPDRRIDSVGGYDASAWTLKLDDAIAGIEDGRWRFWTVDANRNSTWVVIARRNGKKYLKTEADGVEPNNLLALPRCP